MSLEAGTDLPISDSKLITKVQILTSLILVILEVVVVKVCHPILPHCLVEKQNLNKETQCQLSLMTHFDHKNDFINTVDRNGVESNWNLFEIRSI